MKTVLLDISSWDFVLTVSGDIAVASEPYALAQDAASAIKLFIGEIYYDTTKGVPYYQTTLGKLPPISLLKAQLVNAALTVPGVVAADCFITSFTDRKVTGQVHVTDNDGLTSVAEF